MENKKKMIFNVLFLFLVFAATIYGVFHGEDLSEIAEILNSEFILVASGCCLCDYLYLGRVNYYILYDAYAWYSSKEMEMFLVFLCRILFQLYHTIRNRRTAGADLLYEERENSNPGINACIDDCHDYL